MASTLSTEPTRARGIVLCCVLFALACAVGGAGVVLPPGHRGVCYIGAHVLASLAMLFAYRLVDASTVGMLALTGVVCRLLLVPVPPYTTHDVTRYMFDGAMTLAGFDPYTVPPGDLRLAGLHALWPSALEHARYPTLYPPLALSAFSLCALFGPASAWLVWKALVAVASLVTLHVARGLMSPKGFALVALSPILVLEGGIGAHLDVLTVMAVILAVNAFGPGRRGAWLGVGVLLKLTPITLVAPAAMFAWTSPWRALRVVVGALSVIAVGYGIAALMGYQAVGSLQAFFGGWSFGSPWMLVEGPLHVARPVVLRTGLVVGAIAMFVSCWLAYRERFAPAALLAACAPFIASPVVFPWYLATAAVLIGFAPSPVVIAWMTALPLTYEVIDRFDLDYSWHPALWPIGVMVAAVVLAALPWSRWRRKVTA